MIDVAFKNMDSSESLRRYLQEQVAQIISHFPRPSLHHTRVTLDVHNSRFHQGKDHFTTKIVAVAKGDHPIVVEKKGLNIHESVQLALHSFKMAVEKYSDKYKFDRRRRNRMIEAPVEMNETESAEVELRNLA